MRAIKPRLGSALRKHMRANVVAYMALVVAMSGTAGALQGTNTVTSDDIAPGEVKEADLGDNAVGTAKIGPNEVGASDFGKNSVDGSKVDNGTLTAADFGPDSLSGFDITDLTGSDVDESSLAQVASATVGGRARQDYTEYPYGLVCNPTSTTYVVCASMDLSLPANGRVLILGSGTASAHESNALGTCALWTSATGGFGAVEVRQDDDGIGDDYGGDFQMSMVTAPLGPGNIQVQIHCNQTDADIEFYRMFISAVQIGPG